MKKIDKKIWFLICSVAYFVVIGAIIMFADFAKVVDATGKDVAFMDGLYHYNWQFIYDTFQVMGTAGRKSYTIFHILDYFFLTSYFLVMLSLTLLVLPKEKKIVAVVFPLMPALFDLIENTLIEILSGLYPVKYPVLAKITAVITTLKWGSGVVWFSLFIGMVMGFLTIRYKNKKTMAKK